jgi:hypothetical protein
MLTLLLILCAYAVLGMFMDALGMLLLIAPQIVLWLPGPLGFT